MDQQLLTAREEGLAPEYFILREEEWAEIKERLGGMSGVVVHWSKNTYKGVQVRTGSIGDDDLSRLVLC